jgi:hypothetical protein
VDVPAKPTDDPGTFRDQNLAEARDMLGTVLTRDRVDIPAVTQRRQLAQADPPCRTRAIEPDSNIPAWIGPWQTQLENRRQAILDDLADQDRTTG